jgi:hypothetical protein
MFCLFTDYLTTLTDLRRSTDVSVIVKGQALDSLTPEDGIDTLSERCVTG